MASQVATTQSQTRSPGHRGRRGRGRGGYRGGARGGGGGGAPRKVSDGHKSESTTTPSSASEPKESESPTEEKGTKSQAEQMTEDAEDAAVCWICAEPVKYYSVSQCNHRTCHVCALRLRALYKKMDCTFCKEPQLSVIFTVSPDAPWASYTPDSIPYKDPKLSICFETQEMMEDSLILLRFNCPDPDCDYIANGWSDLKLHTRATHGKLMCDLCIRFKKVFAHEHALYSPNQLPYHLPSMRGHRSGPPKEQIEGGIHPLCEFCRECFFSDDEIYAHMRERHEECFVCKRNEVKDQYFRNYDALEQHFNHAHHPCSQPSCLVQKFVVFGSALDLKAHMVEEHGADMSAKDKRDARRIQADFEFEEVGVGGRRGRRDRGDREGEREPPPHVNVSNAGPSSRPVTAGIRRREAFGGNLTLAGDGNANATPTGGSRAASRRPSPSPAGDIDPAVAERHNAFLARVSSMAPNPNNAVPAVKAAIRSYRANESAARDLISTVWNVLDRNLEGTASIINALVDLLDEEDKKKDLLEAWNGFKIEQRNQFPALVPVGTGTEWAGITGGRVLNAKQATTSRSSSQSSRQVLDRVARAAASSSTSSPLTQTDRFPPLQSNAANAAQRQGQRNTPWASSAASSSTFPALSSSSSQAQPIRGPISVPGPGARIKNRAPTVAKMPILSKSAFPSLPTTGQTVKVPRAAIGGNQALRNILGGSPGPSDSVWGGGTGSGKNSADGSGANTPRETGDGAEGGDTVNGGGGGGGKGKKGKGKQKQTLFTLGSFPT